MLNFENDTLIVEPHLIDEVSDYIDTSSIEVSRKLREADKRGFWLVLRRYDGGAFSFFEFPKEMKQIELSNVTYAEPEPDIVEELRQTLKMLNEQIEHTKGEAERVGCEPVQLRTPKGDYIMVDLLSAKAQVLNALAANGWSI